ncbi:hypothetical protein D3C80_931480 [compost metagenome]
MERCQMNICKQLSKLLLVIFTLFLRRLIFPAGASCVSTKEVTLSNYWVFMTEPTNRWIFTEKASQLSMIRNLLLEPVRDLPELLSLLQLEEY